MARRRERPKLRARAVVFAVLLLLFGVGMLVVGRSVGVTKTGLPPERHPCLLIAKKEDLGPVRERLGRAPYSVWWERLLQGVTRYSPTPGRSATGAELAARAKALAFAYAVTCDRGYADAAAQVLRSIHSYAQGRRQWRSLDDIVDGTVDLAIAYDLLSGYLRSHQALEMKTRLTLYGLGRELSLRASVWPNRGSDTREVRRLSALGLCALAIRDYPPPKGRSGPQEWYAYARQGLMDALQHQVARDGAWAEGPGRHFEAARVYLPFLIAISHVTGEQLVTDRALKACEWSVRIRMPNGLRPNVDGSVLTPSCSYALSQQPNIPGFFQWDAQNTDLGHTVPDNQLAEALCWYDDQRPATKPPWPPSQVLEASGDIIFRNDWSAHSNYLLLRAERGQARTAGSIYEQADATSLVLCQGEETLVPDTGFGSWKNRKTTSHHKAHSLVLINGLPAPPVKGILQAGASVDVDVAITDLVLKQEISAARVNRQFGGAVFERTVVFADKRDFFVFDRVTAQQGSHDFTWLLHLNAGGTTGGTLRRRGSRAQVVRPKARLGIYLVSSSPGAACLTTFTDTLYFHKNRPQTHAVLQAEARGVRGTSFLCLLSPRAGKERPTSVSVLRGDEWLGMRLASGTTALFRTGGTQLLSYAGLRASADAVVWTPGDQGEPRHVLILGGTRLWVNDRLRWRASVPRSVLWRPSRPVSSSAPKSASAG